MGAVGILGTFGHKTLQSARRRGERSSRSSSPLAQATSAERRLGICTVPYDLRTKTLGKMSQEDLEATVSQRMWLGILAMKDKVLVPSQQVDPDSLLM